MVISGMPGDGDDVARAGLLGRHPVERLGHQQLGDLDPLDGAVGAAPGDRLALADRALVHPAQRQPAEVGRGVEVGDVRLQRCALGRTTAPGPSRGSCVNSGSRSCASGHARRRPGARGRPDRPWPAVDDRELDLRPRRRRGRGTARTSRRRPRRCGRPDRSTLLMTRTTGSRFCSALRSTNRVCGSGPSLASTSSRTPSTISRPRSTSPPKSAWPGVSMMLMVTLAAVGHGVPDRGVLREDRDALLALEVHRVHDPVVDRALVGLVGREGPGLPEHRVDERGLAVVDVGDDRDVAQVGARVRGQACGMRCDARLRERVRASSYRSGPRQRPYRRIRRCRGISRPGRGVQRLGQVPNWRPRWLAAGDAGSPVRDDRGDGD